MKAKRDQVAAAWITPAIGAALATAGTPATPATGGSKPAVSAPVVTPFNPTVAVRPPRSSSDFVEHLNALAGGRSSTTPIQIVKKEVITTQAKFKPPVEILVEAKTDSTDLRIGYAADQIIFNWERGKDQFRID